jgi:hypothetical protein
MFWMARGYINSVANRLPKLVTAAGVLCLAIGVAWAFIDDRTNFRVDFLDDYAGVFLITLGVGTVLSFAGTIA